MPRSTFARAGLWLFAAVCPPAALAAPCAGFSDVDDTSPFCASVAWMKNRGVTFGCGDGTTYCPGDAVTRLQMAAFMKRLGDQTFLQGGNGFGAPGKVGTADNQPMEILANASRAIRIEPDLTSPNVLMGHWTAGVYTGVYGATIAGGGTGGTSSPVDNSPCTTGFGCVNGVTDAFGTVGGGEGNKAGDLIGSTSGATHATVGGGFNNAAMGADSTVGGGRNNRAIGNASVVPGGERNEASGIRAAVSGGALNTASGLESAVIGGFGNAATATRSIAGGSFARAVHPGCIVLGDEALGPANAVTCGAANQFIVRARGGVYLFTGGTTDLTYTGVYVSPGSSSWLTYSDRAGKHDLAVVDPVEVAKRVASLPMATWRWKHEGGEVRHMGPMAQDFHAAFGLGPSERHIATVDADGVALAAIQGLHRMLRDRDEALARHRAEIDELRARVDALARALPIR
jgi:hypothetical protein